ncbi:MAG: hypothetical protein QNL80_10040 [Akkermansiaceae bacterium]
MKAHNFETKTEASDFPLRELDRRKKLRAFMKKGLALPPDELKEALYKNYSPDAIMVPEESSSYSSKKKK